MTTGCLKNQHDLHQGGTALCSRVSCILQLKNGVGSKLNPFVCILLSIKQKVRRPWLPKIALLIERVLHIWDYPEVFSPAALNPPVSMALSLLILTCFHCSPFVTFPLAKPLKAWLVSDRSILKRHCRSLQLALYMARTGRWTTQLQADGRTSPLIHWLPRKPVCLQLVNFFCKKTFFLNN